MVEELTKIAAEATIRLESFGDQTLESASDGLSRITTEMAQQASVMESLQEALRTKVRPQHGR
eukprot:1176581-Prorocentrum_minimum.AAC.2